MRNSSHPAGRSRPISIAALLEAALFLAAASVAIRLLPVRMLLRSRRSTHTTTSASLTEIESIGRALAALGRRLPWRTLCFEQGLAAHWILSARGRTSMLHYGAASIDGELRAHVWVTSGVIPVIGCENSGAYAILSQIAHGSSS